MNMKYAWMDEYCLSKKGVEKDYKVEWEMTRYMIRGKMFAAVGGDKNGKPIITVKLEPAHGALLRDQFEGDIIPGYYMNKEHWNSMYIDGMVPDDTLKGMLDEAYSIVLGSFSKKQQQEITGR